MRDTKSFVCRQSDIIAAAIDVFAEIGYFRATTRQIADRVQISQSYVFHFFASKEKLLMTALEVSWSRIIASFREVVKSASSERIQEGAIQEVMQRGFREVHMMVLKAFSQSKIPNPEEKAMVFLSRGVLFNIAVAIRLPELKES
ncbi:TetR/AcrR family transcriptional regulator [Paenibacillus whitsoniae]|uniref:TetR/AcrR family transcriptional regulator n=1 Tax=Paenibacillus whitsoniae TaxID=2496558 RepID=A0A430J7L2_9BACL|nr:TetR/AcrR family transcriptional regulator [Paenibacillus whitsoniae]RTE05467.1 TetR/AcrR family transcriptional regulator [Paenibacillus whitsoniae]